MVMLAPVLAGVRRRRMRKERLVRRLDAAGAMAGSAKSDMKAVHDTLTQKGVRGWCMVSGPDSALVRTREMMSRVRWQVC